ncbi:MAG TPA: response regulator [Candidatus Limnocylindria bacterium]|jgi:DNA-binding response OmpR family regulator|nr:response regulator [Candidatus Limnocylindria bacterium]
MAQSIWVVDDEPLIRAAIVAVLEESGFEPRGFPDAEQLYTALVDGGLPDLLILDQMLPDESGSVIVRSLRERAEYRDIPVLFLTAVGDDEADRLAEYAPVLSKPFDFRDLLALVRDVLAAAEHEREEPLVEDEAQA